MRMRSNGPWTTVSPNGVAAAVPLEFKAGELSPPTQAMFQLSQQALRRHTLLGNKLTLHYKHSVARALVAAVESERKLNGPLRFELKKSLLSFHLTITTTFKGFSETLLDGILGTTTTQAMSCRVACSCRSTCKL
jgi:hypothetical protein